MQVAEPIVSSWKASLSLEFMSRNGRSILQKKEHEGPLVIQKPLYPEGGEVCHAIVVHPPGGIAGGDELELRAAVGEGAAALLTTPGAAKWYRSAGPRAKQNLAFEVEGALEWLPRETIVFDGALAELRCDMDLAADAVLIGWDIVCLGRTGSGERFSRGAYRFSAQIRRQGKLLWLERGRIDGNGRLLHSPAGLGGHTVFATMFSCAPKMDPELVAQGRKIRPRAGAAALTLLPGVLLARYLGDSSEEASDYFIALWRILRPALLGREANEPRIWRT
jgi:urease accessory protein